MDSLALLCNLYGNGPATLRRLREAGCTYIEALLDLPVDDLADILVDSPDAARRFQREARRLAARVAEEEQGQLEMEEPLEEELDADDDSCELELEGELDPASDPLVSRALDEWRARDADDAPDASAEEEELEPSPAREPRGESGRGTPLAAGLVPGLDQRWCTALARGGIATLECLSECDADRVALATSLPLTRLMHLRFLARQRVGEMQAAQAPVQAFDPPRPRVSWRLPAPGPGSAAAVSHTPAHDPATLIPQPSLRFSPAERPDPTPASSFESDLLAASQHRPPRTYRTPDPRREPGESAGPFA